MLPIETEIWIPKNDAVRLVSAELEELNYRKLYRAYSYKGRKYTTDPRIIFKVMVYGYMNGIYSSRKLEYACRKNIDYMRLLEGNPVPDHNTFARFRNGRPGEAVEDLFYQYIERLEVLGETDHKSMFIDGTKLESAANRYTFVWRKTTEKYLNKVKAEAQEKLKEDGIEAAATSVELRTLLTNQAAKIEFVHGAGKRKTEAQRIWEKLDALQTRWKEYEKS